MTEAEKELPLVGAKEATVMLGVSKQYISQLVKKGRLKPALVLACGKIFWIKDIEALKGEIKHYKK